MRYKGNVIMGKKESSRVTKLIGARVIPPRSIVELVKADTQTPLWKNRIGERYRIGYYNPQHGLQDIWLVDEDGTYLDVINESYLSKYFKIVSVSDEKDLFGKKRVPCETNEEKTSEDKMS
jgi:hypothetical protein